MSEQERRESTEYIIRTTYFGVPLTVTQYNSLYESIYRLLEAWDYELVRVS